MPENVSLYLNPSDVSNMSLLSGLKYLNFWCHNIYRRTGAFRSLHTICAGLYLNPSDVLNMFRLLNLRRWNSSFRNTHNRNLPLLCLLLFAYFFRFRLSWFIIEIGSNRIRIRNCNTTLQCFVKVGKACFLQHIRKPISVIKLHDSSPETILRLF